MKLILPYPISSNLYWRSYVPRGWTRAVVAPSDQAKEYKRECAWLAKQYGAKPLRGPVEVRIALVPKNRRRIDLSNCWKVAEDALQGLCFADDSQVWRLLAELREPDGNGRLEVEVLPYVVPVLEAA